MAEFEIVPGPGVQISEINYRIPDLVVVRAASIAANDKNLILPPQLAVQIASPSTAHYDRNRKRTVYAEFGIPAYWIVEPDPAYPSVTAYGLAEGSYAEVCRAAGERRFITTTPFRSNSCLLTSSPGAGGTEPRGAGTHGCRRQRLG